MAALVIGAAALAAVLFFSRPHRADIASSVFNDSARIASGRLPLELRSDSPQTISRFFGERRIGFPAPAELLEIPGWQLAGARVHTVAGRPSALSLYRNSGNRMIVCQMYKGPVAELPPGAEIVRSGGATLYLFRSSSRTAVFWQDGPIVCALVSEIAEEEILRIAFAKTVKAQT